MDFDGKGNGCKEQIKLTENRVILWTCVYKVKNFQYKELLPSPFPYPKLSSIPQHLLNVGMSAAL